VQIGGEKIKVKKHNFMHVKSCSLDDIRSKWEDFNKKLGTKFCTLISTIISYQKEIAHVQQFQVQKCKKSKTYNRADSLVVTDPTTNTPACGLSMAERTGSPVFRTLWSYVTG
jgi:hypothetical protein